MPFIRPAEPAEAFCLTERERVGLNAAIEERNLECVLNKAAALTDELMQPLFGSRAVAFVVNVESVRSARAAVHQ